jgi:hypothetical protein
MCCLEFRDFALQVGQGHSERVLSVFYESLDGLVLAITACQFDFADEVGGLVKIYAKVSTSSNPFSRRRLGLWELLSRRVCEPGAPA